MSPFRLINCDQALAYGAYFADVKLVASYPGSPSSGTVDFLIKLAKNQQIYLEWSANERVALEMAIGASIVGGRALVCVKSVGMNVMLDTLMALNLTPVNGGLVILLGDDPGGYGSQNDQDTRWLAPMLEMPMLEPATPSEAYKMMTEAFRVSEKFNTVVIIRETRSFTQEAESVNIPEKIANHPDLKYSKESLRYVPVPNNVVEKHRDLHKRLELLTKWAENIPYNQIYGNGKRGIIGAGFAFSKLLDVVGRDKLQNMKLLKLGVLFPFPEKIVLNFFKDCDEVLVLEENEPFVETQLRSLAHDNNCPIRIFGKLTKHVSREGELFRWQISNAVKQFLPDFIQAGIYLEENEKQEYPAKKSYCGDCRYDEVLDILAGSADQIKQKLLIVGDPGCLVTVAERLDAKYSIGSSVAVADGMSKMGGKEKPVALIGDSGFFHSAIPAICNAVHNKSDILLVLLDNGTTKTSGCQPHPGVNKNAFGKQTPALSIEKISKGCGIKHIFSVSLEESKAKLTGYFKQALQQSGLAMVIVKIPDTITITNE